LGGGVDKQRAFDDIKKYLSSLLVMKAPTARILFQLHITVEDAVIGAILMQVNGGKGTHHYILKPVPHRLRNKLFFH
jgi:hypothetical protein